MMIYKWYSKQHHDGIKALAESHEETKDFMYSWTLWKNWLAHPPVIALHDTRVVGFNATTLSKTGYFNLYFHGVDLAYRNMGIASGMLNFRLQQQKGNYNRIKLKTKVGGDGEKFCRALGMRPFAQRWSQNHGTYYIWDEDIRAVSDINTLKIWMQVRQSHLPIPEKEMKKHLRFNPGMELIKYD